MEQTTQKSDSSNQNRLTKSCSRDFRHAESESCLYIVGYVITSGVVRKSALHPKNDISPFLAFIFVTGHCQG